MRAVFLPLTMPFFIAAQPVNMGQATVTSSSAVSGDTNVKVLAAIIAASSSLDDASLSNVVKLAGQLLSQSDVEVRMTITKFIFVTILASSEISATSLGVLAELGTGSVTASSDTQGKITNQLLFFSTLEATSMVLGQIDIRQECRPVANIWSITDSRQFDAVAPTPWYAQDHFVYQAPEPVRGLAQPVIGRFWSEPPWVLRAIDGIGHNAISPQMQKVPFQIGETLLNTDASPRVVTMTLRVVGQAVNDNGTQEEKRRNLFFLRNVLSQALAVQPLDNPIPGARPSLGRLFYFREREPVLMLECVPRLSPQFTTIAGIETMVDADIEFVAPMPYWVDVGFPGILEARMRQCWFYPSGGMEYPFEFTESGEPVIEGLEFTGFQDVLQLDNSGDLRTPIVFTLRGPYSGFFELINDTVGQKIRVLGSIDAHESMIINTAFGEKTITLLNRNTGETSSALGLLDFEVSRFWQMERGLNTIRLLVSAGATETTIGRIQWHNRFAGV